MRFLALLTALLGCLLIGVGGFGLQTTIAAWDILGGSGAAMGLQPDHWRSHWVATAVVYIAVGLTFMCFAVGLRRGSRRVASAWCITVTALSVVWLPLYLLHPLPFGFQQVPFVEVAFFVGLSLVSWLLIRSHQRRHAKGI